MTPQSFFFQTLFFLFNPYMEVKEIPEKKDGHSRLGLIRRDLTFKAYLSQPLDKDS